MDTVFNISATIIILISVNASALITDNDKVVGDNSEDVNKTRDEDNDSADHNKDSDDDKDTAEDNLNETKEIHDDEVSGDNDLKEHEHKIVNKCVLNLDTSGRESTKVKGHDQCGGSTSTPKSNKMQPGMIMSEWYWFENLNIS